VAGGGRDPGGGRLPEELAEAIPFLAVNEGCATGRLINIAGARATAGLIPSYVRWGPSIHSPGESFSTTAGSDIFPNDPVGLMLSGRFMGAARPFTRRPGAASSHQQ